MPEIPTGLSGFDNDMNYIMTETDPTVPSWAKASTKPTYTASEVGAVPERITSGNHLNSIIMTATKIDLLYDNDADPRDEIVLNDSGITLSVGNRGGSNNLQITASGTTIHNVVNPTTATDAANKGYVDSAVAAITHPVSSVNGATGVVVLTASSVGALADSTTFVSSFNGETGAITYSAPVTSVNGATGVVSLSASDVGALPDTYTAPVTSVNGATGVVVLTASNVGAIPDSNTITITNKAGAGETSSSITFNNTAHTGQYTNFLINPNDNTISITNRYGPTYGIMGSTKIIGIGNPTEESGAANKRYVDSAVAAITHPVSSVNGTTGTVVVDAVKTTAASTNTEYNLIGTASSNANTSAVTVYNQNLLSFAKTNDLSRLTIGSTATPGVIRIYTSASSGTGFTDIKSNASSTNERTITLPDASGTVALTTDIPDVPAWALASSKPSYTFSELTSHPTTLGNYGITDAYTKTEVDGLVSGVLHYKGTKTATTALPSSGNVTGDVWHVSADGSEWAWDGSEWQELGTATDLSGYVPTSRTVNGKALTSDISLTASDVSALPSSTTYVSSFNGQKGAVTYTPPVTSVNGNTGAVTLSIPSTAADVGALPSSTTFVSSFNGETGAVTYTAPVTSVNGATGTVVLSIPSTYFDVGAASSSHAHGNLTSGGDITATATIASGDRIVINDESASKITNSSITFGSSTSQYLANNGTWQNVPTTLPASDVSDWAKASSKPSYTASEVGAASSTHAHGNITSGGDITTTATIASGDRIVINDESASKVTNSSITFGSSTTQYLANNGTWQNVPATYDDTALAARVTALENIPWVTYYTGSTTPSNAQGNNGDLYFQTSE